MNALVSAIFGISILSDCIHNESGKSLCSIRLAIVIYSTHHQKMFNTMKQNYTSSEHAFATLLNCSFLQIANTIGSKSFALKLTLYVYQVMLLEYSHGWLDGPTK